MVSFQMAQGIFWVYKLNYKSSTSTWQGQFNTFSLCCLCRRKFSTIVDAEYELLKTSPSAWKPQQQGWGVTNMQVLTRLSMKIRKWAFGKNCHKRTAVNDVILALWGKKEQAYESVLWNTHLTRNWFVQNLQDTIRRLCTGTLSI